MGNRFRGAFLPGAMRPLHQYFGNPLLTAIGRLFFRSDCRDFYCGLRGFDRQAILALDLQAPGMEFALEMLVKATILGLRVTEVPTTLSPDGARPAAAFAAMARRLAQLALLLAVQPAFTIPLRGARHVCRRMPYDGLAV